MILPYFTPDENEYFLFPGLLIIMSGERRHIDDLRILTFIELCLNSGFYAKHPSFLKVMNSHYGVFNNVITWIALSVSNGALVSSKTKMKLVKEETFNIWSPLKCSGLLALYCVLALSSVCLHFVHCYYKSYHAMLKHKIMFNQLIKPREFICFNS